jgi:hypothetical protein
MSNLGVLRNHVGFLRKEYNLTDFVETGCYLGDGILRCKEQGFLVQNCYTCDIGEEFVKHTKNLWPQAHVECADSITFLQNLLPKLENRTLFWLDAHFPEYFNLDFTDEKYRMPLIDEIEVIKVFKKNYSQDVFLIDDTHCFKSDDNPMYVEGKLSDQLIVENGWHRLLSSLSDTHRIEHLTEMEGEPNFEGVLVCVPK